MDSVSESYDGAVGGATTALGGRLATGGGDDGRRVRIRRRGQLWRVSSLTCLKEVSEERWMTRRQVVTRWSGERRLSQEWQPGEPHPRDGLTTEAAV
jgi:hypothetical protein